MAHSSAFYGQHGKCNGCETCATSIYSNTKRHMGLELVMRDAKDNRMAGSSTTWWRTVAHPMNSTVCGTSAASDFTLVQKTKPAVWKRVSHRHMGTTSAEFANLVSFLYKYLRTKSSSNEVVTWLQSHAYSRAHILTTDSTQMVRL